MQAAELLSDLCGRGVAVSVLDGDRVRVSPAGVITEHDRDLIRTHRTALIQLLTTAPANDPAMTPATAPTLATTSCATCTHRTKARTCGAPVAAGLAGHFTLIWVDLIGGHGTTCAAHEAREMRRPQEALPRLTSGQVRAVIGWNDAEMDRASGFMRQANRHGFDIDVAERITDHLMLRDRQHDELHMCIECRHLTLSGRCVEAAAGRLDRSVHNDHPVKAKLFRCAGFTKGQS